LTVISNVRLLLDKRCGHLVALTSVLRACRSILVALTFLSFISGFLGAALLSVISKAAINAGSNDSSLLVMFILLTAAVLFSQHAHRYLAALVATRAEGRLRIELAQRVLASSLRSVERHHASGLLTILTHDVAGLSSGIKHLPTMMSNLALVAGALIYMMVVAGPRIVISLYAVLFLSVVVYARMLATVQPVYERVRHAYSKLMGHVTDLITGIKELKMDPEMSARFVNNHLCVVTEELAGQQLSAACRHSTAMYVGQGLLFCSVIGMVIFAYPFFVGLSSDVVTALVLTVLYIAGPLEGLLMLHPVFAWARTSLTKIAELDAELSRSEEAADGANAIAKPFSTFERLDLVEACFDYGETSGDGARIGPLNLTIRRGEVVFIVGGNGSGKTTMVKLLSGLYTPTSGVVAVNGRAVTQSLRAYRDCFSVVFSDFHVMETALALYDLDKVAGEQMAADFGLDGHLRKASTLKVQELSQGQRRRLAILLAAIQPRPVHIFDEPGSDLDPPCKTLFYGDVLNHLRMQGKTVVVVSNDDRLYRQADKVITMRDGKIVSVSHEGISSPS
jgi:putative pyoverdin transport system ATP-binding/permease protein